MTGAKPGLLSTQPTLRTIDAVGQALAIGPIVSVGLGMFLLAGVAGPATPFVIIVVGLGSAALGWCVSLYARRYAGAGGIYEYLTGAFGPAVGVIATGLYFLPALIANGSALVVSLLWQDAAVRHLGFDPGWWSGGLVSIAVVALLVHGGVKVSVRGALALTVLSAVPFVVTAAAIIWQGGAAGNSISVFTPAGVSTGNLGQAILFAILLFIGFEAAACTGEEARLPHEAIPRAIVWSVAAAGGFYLLMGYAATVGFGPDRVAEEWGGNPTALASLGDRYLAPPTGALMSLAIVMDALAVQLAVFNQFARGYFAMARDGLLPSPLARVSRHETPSGGLVAVVAANLLVMAYATVFPNRFDVFEITATALTLCSLPAFLLLGIGAGTLTSDRRQRRLVVPVALVAVTVPGLGIYGTLSPFPTGLRAAGTLLAVAMFGGAALWYRLLVHRRPAVWRGVGAHALVRRAPTTPEP